MLHASAMAAPPPLRPHAALLAPKRLVSPPLVHAPTLAELQPVPRPHDGGGLRRDLPVPVVAHDSRHAPPDPHAILTPSALRVAPGRAPSNGVRQGSPAIAPGVRRAASVVGGSGCNATPSSAPSFVLTDPGTGINPWWRFIEGPIPGVGRYYVNVATQNFMIQVDDMNVHNAGIDLAFRRTVNSMSRHDVNGSDGATPTTMGNAWTSTFDAHLAGNASGGLTVSDIDGARYDYSGDGQGHWTSSTPGQYATLTTADGGATYQWTKKSGSAYLFAGPFVNNGNSYEGYNGRLLKIYGRNRNTYIALTYYWVCGDAASNANLAEIDASTQSGVTAKLYFGSFAGHQLLSRLVWPDGATTVTYNYNAGGTLVNVQKPGSNDSGAMANEVYLLAADHTMVESPRYVASNGAEGGYLNVSTSATTRQFLGLQSAGVMNFTPSDSTNVPLQSGVSTSPMQYNWMALTNVSSGLNQVSDTDGHDSYYYFDASNRVTEVSEWTGSQWLATFYGWDAMNNLVADVDARGYETDYAYDGSGNTIAVGEPTVTAQTSGGSQQLRPTRLYSYDQYNNVVAYCDQTWSQKNGRDWDATGTPVVSGSLCPVTVGSAAQPGATVMSYAYPSWEPFGEVTAITTPMGYQRSMSYVAPGAGTDYGLPVAVTGTAVTQVDGSTPLQLKETFGHDASGNLTAYGTGNGTWNLTYDTLDRLTSATDPDGHASYTTYFADGAVSKTETAAQRAANDAKTYSFDAGVLHTYDLDGDELTQVHHHGNVAGTTQNWYDGADRLVEVALPGDSTSSPVYTRYLYDLSGGGNVSVGGISVRAYGNLYDTKEYTTPPGTSTAAFVDARGQGFDALDRPVSKIALPPNTTTMVVQTALSYDSASATLGLLASTTDAVGETTRMTYDALGRKTDIAFSNDGGTTPHRTYAYDPNGRPAIVTSDAFGTQTSRYDADDRLTSLTEPSGSGVSSPAVIGYDYYPDGHRKDLTVQSSALSAPATAPLMTYMYRADGKRTALTFAYAGASYPFTWTYTNAGRPSSQTDPFTGAAVPHSAGTAPPAATYAAKHWTYDANGDVQTLALPVVGQYQQMTHDLEGALSGYGVQPSQRAGSTAPPGFVYQFKLNVNVAGEATEEDIINPAPGAATVVSRFSYSNGHAIPYPGNLAGYPHSGYVSYDLLSGVRTAQAIYGKNSEGGLQCPNPNLTTDQYDNAGRHTATNADLYDDSCNDGKYTDTNTYDAENHAVQAVQTGAVASDSGIRTWGLQWGPNGHPIALQQSPNSTTLTSNPSTTYLHYDGDILLFTTYANGQLADVRPELLGTAYPAPAVGGTPQLTVMDRDFAELNVTSHSASGYSGLNYGSGPFHNGKVTIPQTIYEPASDGTPPYFDNGQPEGMLQYTHADGFYTPLGRIQGVRAMDTDLGTWKSPDAYAGDVHDPLSQKPYMWNRNNPYQYSDPSGYCAEDLCIGEALVALGLAVMRSAALHGPEITDAVAHPGGGAGAGGVSAARQAMLDARAAEIHGALHPIAQRMRTTAVTETSTGTRIVTSSEGKLSKGQRGALTTGEIEGSGTAGTHAEIQGLQNAIASGQLPTGVGVSRAPCPGQCNPILQALGLRVK